MRTATGSPVRFGCFCGSVDIKIIACCGYGVEIKRSYKSDEAFIFSSSLPVLILTTHRFHRQHQCPIFTLTLNLAHLMIHSIAAMMSFHSNQMKDPAQDASLLRMQTTRREKSSLEYDSLVHIPLRQTYILSRKHRNAWTVVQSPRISPMTDVGCVKSEVRMTSSKFCIFHSCHNHRRRNIIAVGYGGPQPQRGISGPYEQWQTCKEAAEYCLHRCSQHQDFHPA